ncbi:hypothetical protein [Nonomuraea sp. NPDC003754]
MVHFRERAIERGMPEEAVLLEPNASNTGQKYERAGTLHYQRAYLRVSGRLSTTDKRLEMRPDSTGLEIIG